MQLVINKKQHSGLTGVTFIVEASVSTSQEEKDLVKKYRIGNAVLLRKKLVGLFGQPLEQEINVTADDLLRGQSFKCKNLEEVMSYIESLKQSCQTLLGYVATARNFEGQEVWDITTPLVETVGR
jgi:hypothetical protein